MVNSNGTFETERALFKVEKLVAIKDLEDEDIYEILKIKTLSNKLERLLMEEVIYREEQIMNESKEF